MGKLKVADVGENIKNKEKSEKAHKSEANKVHVSGLKGGQRVAVVEAEAPVVEETVAEVKTSGGRVVTEKVRGKKYVASKVKVQPGKAYPVKDAIKLVKETSFSKFEGTMELHLILKKNGISAQVALPFQAGKTKKVEIATDETIEKLKNGKIDFDILVATAVMMPKIVPFARLLGPKGLMPNPKNGTLVNDVKKAQAFSTATITVKTEKEAPLVHTVVGKNNQKDEEILANIEAVLKVLGGGKQIVRAFLKSTMSPSVKLLVE